MHSENKPASILDSLSLHAQAIPNVIAFRFLDEDGCVQSAITYHELDRNVRAISYQLQHFLPPSERALLFYPPGIEFVQAFLACIHAGIVAVPAPLPLMRNGMASVTSMANDCTPTAVLSAGPSFGRSRNLFSANSSVGNIRWIDTSQMAACDVGRRTVHGHSPSYLQYTSGSTQEARGVVVSNHNLLSNLEHIHFGVGQSSQSSAVLWLPHYHDMGLLNQLYSLFVGFPCTILSPMNFVKRPVSWLTAITEYQATYSGAPNFAYELCTSRISDEDRFKLDLSSWKVAFCGAETVRQKTLETFHQRFKQCGFRYEAFNPCYGLAEFTAALTGKKSQLTPVYAKSVDCGHGAPNAVGCGMVGPNHEVCIVDPITKDVLPDLKIGEIWASGPSKAEGYWNRPDETEEVFSAFRSDASGPYLRTGDLGFVSSGELFVTGRSKELIIVRGKNFSPQDIEFVAGKCHAAVSPSEIAAFSVENRTDSYVIVVVAIKRGYFDSDLDLVREAIQQTISERLELDIDVIVLVKPGEIPKTANGKVQRFKCRDKYCSNSIVALKVWNRNHKLEDSKHTREYNSESPKKTGADDIKSWLINRVSQLSGIAIDRIDIHAPFVRYGLSSLTAVELSVELENLLGWKLSQTLVYDFPTIELLSEALSSESNLRHHSSVPVDSKPTDEIAIVGMSCRFPGANGLIDFWNLLKTGGVSIQDLPSSRESIFKKVRGEMGVAEYATISKGGYIDNCDMFHASLFGIAPREAVAIDPQQRLLLEVTWEAIQDSGLPISNLKGGNTGVFVGISTADYSSRFIGYSSKVDPYWVTGNSHAIAANRISYSYDFRGPSVAVDTACSSSLVAVHLACNSLRNGECELAVVGGANLIFNPDISIGFAKAGALSPNGSCRPFDIAANGMVRGEGIAAIVLKPRKVAERDGDRVYAIIAGSAVNQDGRSNGLTAPNRHSQESVIRSALRKANLAPKDVSYIEAHGAGTPLGDAIEVSSIQSVFEEHRDATTRCAIGSVKANIGHAEAAAGLAGIIKVALSLYHGLIPPQPSFQLINPNLQLDAERFLIPEKLTTWPGSPSIRSACVSSFGFGGTNSNVVLQSTVTSTTIFDSPPNHPSDNVLLISASSSSGLRKSAQKWHEWLSSESFAKHISIRDLCQFSATRREHLEHRHAFVVRGVDDAARQLGEFATEDVDLIQQDVPPNPIRDNGLVFVFSGHGGQWWAMAKTLIEEQSVFSSKIDECEELLSSQVKWSLREELTSSSQLASNLEGNRIEVIHVCLFAFQVSLAELWASWGIEPDAVVGHSMGEVAACYVAGALDLQTALRVIVARSKTLEKALESADVDTGMLAARVSPEQAAPFLSGYESNVNLAVQNSPEYSIFAGDNGSLDSIAKSMKFHRIPFRRLNVSGAGHSPSLKKDGDTLEKALDGIRPTVSKKRLFSTIRGAECNGAEFNAVYWGESVHRPVLFSQVINQLTQSGMSCFVELSPQPLLLSAIRQCAAKVGRSSTVLATLERSKRYSETMLKALGEMHSLGRKVNWSKVYPTPSAWVELPSHTWDTEKHWMESGSFGELKEAGVNCSTPNSHEGTQNVWVKRLVLDNGGEAYLLEHLVQSTPILPSAFYLEIAHSLVKEVVGIDIALTNVEFLKTANCSRFPISLKIVIDRSDSTKSAFQILTNSVHAHGDEEEWTLNARGNFAASDCEFSSFPIPILEANDGESSQLFRLLGLDKYSVDQHYREFENRGVSYGPAFRGLNQIWKGQRSALGKISRPQSLTRTNSQLMHPALIDAALQLLGDAASQDLNSNDIRDTYLPVSVRESRFVQCEADSLWCFASINELDAANHQRVSGDVTICNESGIVVATVKGFTVERLSQRSHEDDLSRSLCRITWVPRDGANVARTTKDKTEDYWLVFADSTGRGRQLVDKLRTNMERVVAVFAGNKYGKLDSDEYSVQLDSYQDLTQLFEELRESNPGNSCFRIAYLWSLECPEALEDPDLRKSCEFGSLGIIRLLQSLKKLLIVPNLRLLVFSLESTPIDCKYSQSRITQLAIHGLVGSISQEYPSLRVKLVEISASDSFGDEGSLIFEELFVEDDEERVAIQAKKRLVARLQSYVLANTSTMPIAFRSEATYLITGGMGDLGLLVARWMVTRGAKRLLLLGKSTFPDRREWAQYAINSVNGKRIAMVRSIEAMGASVHIASADVCDSKELSRTLREYEEELWPPISGVFHLAGVVRADAVETITAEEFHQVFDPKALGAWNLHTHFLKQSLDFFVMFSSGASVLGSPFLCSYATANSFIDALANLRQQSGLPAISINWGYWSECGIAARLMEQNGRSFAPVGMQEIHNRAGLLALEKAMLQPLSQIGVLPFDWPAWVGAHSAFKLNPLLELLIPAVGNRVESERCRPAEILTRSQILHSIPSERPVLVKEYLRRELAAVLRCPDQSVDVDRPLNAFGIDSLMAIELKARVEETLLINLPMVRFLEGPSITELAATIIELVLLNDPSEPIHTESVLADAARSLAANIDEDMQLIRRLHEMGDDEVLMHLHQLENDTPEDEGLTN